MNEAELITAFHGLLTHMYALIFGYVSLMSGFLVMSYFVADKIKSILAAIVLGLFAAVSAVLILNLLFVRNDLEALLSYIIEQIQAGNLDLPWFGTNPVWASEILTYLILIFTVGGFLGCVVFFFIQKRHLKSDAEPT